MCSRRPLTRGDVAAEVPRPDEHGAAQSVEVALRHGQGFADPQARALEQHDQRSRPEPEAAVTGAV
jgi:hypothetical protein